MKAFDVLLLATPVLALILGWLTAEPQYGPGPHYRRFSFDHARFNKLNAVLALAFLLTGTLEGLEVWLNHVSWYAATAEEAASFTQPIFIATANDPKQAWIFAILGTLVIGFTGPILYVVAIEARHRFDDWNRFRLLKRENDKFWKSMRREVKIPGTQKVTYAFTGPGRLQYNLAAQKGIKAQKGDYLAQDISKNCARRTDSFKRI